MFWTPYVRSFHNTHIFMSFSLLITNYLERFYLFLETCKQFLTFFLEFDLHINEHQWWRGGYFYCFKLGFDVFIYQNDILHRQYIKNSTTKQWHLETTETAGIKGEKFQK